jgi:uncharacterized membrane protein YkoI
MTNYQNGKIYKIEAHNGEEGDTYIGSTCKQYLSQRMSSHRNSYNCWKNGKLNYITAFSIFDKYGVDNCVIILLEDCPCNTIDELYYREAFHMKSMKCVNNNIPLRTQKEYKEDNKEKMNKYLTQYYIDNRDRRIEYGNQYRKDNKEQTNKNARKRYNINKEKIENKIVCDCGKEINVINRANHLKTKVHNKFILCKK